MRLRELRQEMNFLIRFYEKRGWRWNEALEFLLRLHNDTMEPLVIRTRIGTNQKNWRRLSKA